MQAIPISCSFRIRNLNFRQKSPNILGRLLTSYFLYLVSWAHTRKYYRLLETSMKCTYTEYMPHRVLVGESSLLSPMSLILQELYTWNLTWAWEVWHRTIFFREESNNEERPIKKTVFSYEVKAILYRKYGNWKEFIQIGFVFLCIV